MRQNVCGHTAHSTVYERKLPQRWHATRWFFRDSLARRFLRGGAAAAGAAGAAAAAGAAVAAALATAVPAAADATGALVVVVVVVLLLLLLLLLLTGAAEVEVFRFGLLIARRRWGIIYFLFVMSDSSNSIPI